MASSLADLSLAAATTGLGSKEFSALELLEAVASRSEQLEGRLNSFITETRELAHAQALEVDQLIAAGESLPLLAGVPVAIKDNIALADVPLTAGSGILRNYVAPYHATAVRKLLDHKAVVVGKTNCDEFAMGSSGETSAYGPTKNPWDETRVPGGSSSGSAAAVAAGQALYALGSDTGGSVRQPASLTNLVGLKPTYGRISRYGLIALASSFDTIGTFTRSVADAQLVATALFGRDQNDATSSHHTFQPSTLKDVKGLTIGVPKEFFIDGLDPAVEKIVRQVIDWLEGQGATIVDVSLPSTVHALPVYYVILPAEASSNLARYDGIRYGLPVSEASDSLIDLYEKTRAAGFGPEVKRRIMLGTYTLSAGYVDAYYKQAAKVRQLIRQEYDEVFQQVDCLIGAVAPTPAFKLGEKVDDPLTMYLSDVLTIAANVVGCPAIAVPAGLTNGLPVGVQLMARPWAEATLFQVGQAIETGFPVNTQRPPVATASQG